MQIDRRTALTLLGAGAVAPVARGEAALPANPFRHGVASGDPTAQGAILWTRVSPVAPAGAAPIAVRWYVAESEGAKPVARGNAQARAARDYTVKVEPRGLRAGHDYVYWFETGGQRSPVGRFRTLPVGPTADAVFAVVSCQSYPGGFFNAYRSIAGRNRLDAVIHLGDYIYEYGPKGFAGSIGAKIGRIPDPAHEIVTLADYRTRHAQYKADPDLQAAHARAAFICVWDDHEVANDDWKGGAKNHQPETEGDWKRRKAVAMQAYFEWMPIRDPIPGRPWEAINRAFQFGDLATLLMLETRLLARSKQADFGDMPDADTFARTLAECNRPERELLGPPQLRWLGDQLAASVAARRPWQVIGNQIIMARVAGPDLERAVGPERAKTMMDAVDPERLPEVRRSQASYRAGLPFNLDSWDGYPAARERLYAAFRASGAKPIILSGDSHAFWANDLFDADKQLVAAEFGTSAISSPSIGDALPSLPLGELLTEANEEVVMCDQNAKGYIVLTLTPAAARADYVALSTIYEPTFTARALASFALSAAARDARIARGA